MFILKKNFFKTPLPIMDVINFNGVDIKKTTNFNLEQFHFIQNDKALFNDTKHQNKLFYKLI